MLSKKLIIVRGAGDIATGTIHKLHNCGFQVLALETANPAAIRRQVSFCEAVYEGKQTVEGVQAKLILTIEEVYSCLAQDTVPVLVDPAGESIRQLQPAVLVDAILAKKNLGTSRSMAPLTVALGPGFTAGVDTDLVIETMRGHNLGRIIRRGSGLADTGIPGMIGGYAKERVLHAAMEGTIRNTASIGDMVEQEQEIAQIQGSDGTIVPVLASITGIIRGLIRDGYYVTKGFKIADIDPRKEELENCFTISDKSRCIAGSVVEVICHELFR